MQRLGRIRIGTNPNATRSLLHLARETTSNTWLRLQCDFTLITRRLLSALEKDVAQVHGF